MLAMILTKLAQSLRLLVCSKDRFGRQRRKKSTKPKLDSAPLSSPNRPSTYEAVFIPFRPDTEVRQAIFSIALKEVLA